MKYKVGDTVICVKEHHIPEIVGKVGKVVKIEDEQEKNYIVDFDSITWTKSHLDFDEGRRMSEFELQLITSGDDKTKHLGFEVGDVVRLIGGGITAAAKRHQGYIGTITKAVNSFEDRVGGKNWYWIGDGGIHEWENGLELLKTSGDNKNNKMNTITTMQESVLDKKSAALVKTGFLSADLRLTDKSKDTLMALLFADKKEELVKLAEVELKESK